MIWRFRAGSQWRQMPAEFGPWQTLYDAFARWREAGVCAALMDAMIAEAARRGQADLSLVSVDSTSVRAHQDAAGMRLDPQVLAALEKAAAEEKGRQEPGKPPHWAMRSRSRPRLGGGCDAVAGPGSLPPRSGIRAGGALIWLRSLNPAA